MKKISIQVLPHHHLRPHNLAASSSASSYALVASASYSALPNAAHSHAIPPASSSRASDHLHAVVRGDFTIGSGVGSGVGSGIGSGVGSGVLTETAYSRL